MRILIIHNRYREHGGEDVVVDQEARMLADHGHSVSEFELSNSDALSVGERLRRPVTMAWSRPASGAITDIIRAQRPDVAHIHNTHYRISLAAVSACAGEGVPVVMTLHNYRLMCPAATLFRDGSVCEQCVSLPLAIPSILHGCWRGSRTQTAAVAFANGLHRALGTLDEVDCFIAPSEFARRKHVDFGLPEERIQVRPHSLSSDPGIGSKQRHGFLSLGRLSVEKGTDVLLEAWRQLPDIELTIVGDGPLRPAVDSFIAQHPNHRVRATGSIPREAALSLLREAGALIHPSTCYETFGLAPLEAMATGTAVVVADGGAPADLVDDGTTGRRFRPGDADHLAEIVSQLHADPQLLGDMGLRARQKYETGFRPPEAYRSLISIYGAAVETRRLRRSSPIRTIDQ